MRPKATSRRHPALLLAGLGLVASVWPGCGLVPQTLPPQGLTDYNGGEEAGAQVSPGSGADAASTGGGFTTRDAGPSLPMLSSDGGRGTDSSDAAAGGLTDDGGARDAAGDEEPAAEGAGLDASDSSSGGGGDAASE